MFDREGRVISGSFLVIVLALAGSAVAENQLGIGLHDRPFPSFLLFAGVAVVVPQLYLAFTGDRDGGSDGDRSRTRLRFTAIATAVFAAAFAAEADGLAHLAIGTLGAGSLLGLLCYEALETYQTASEGRVIQLR
ncbi:hypothetical protein [Natrinema salaciae]|uniref:Uncharacterized protein n=1 Tax=Natrinema salaciae TaxID=1186196 RepID=A0A1H9Q123_9EURY|nr:hypothetical protein [Natrinema salaciae]SER53765.1 hypothetical protein SAMN04489841_4045 [Natrinema salaciae]